MSLVRDLRDACRTIVRMPMVAGVVVVSLGIGIGVNTIVFSWIQARMLRPLPGVADSAGIYTIELRNRLGQYPGASWLEYQDLQRALTAMPDVIASRMTPLYVGEPGHVERAFGLLVSANYFTALGLRPAAGRFPSTIESTGGGTPVAVIAHGLWERQFGSDPTVIGRAVRVNGVPLTIVGVTPREFRGTVTGLFFEVYLPAVLADDVIAGSTELTDRGTRGYLLAGRLREGATRAQAQTELDATMTTLARMHPGTNGEVRGEITPFWNAPRGPARMLNTALSILQGVMLLVLAAVCGNTATLVLARFSARYRQIGVRLALGASPRRVARLLLLETLLMSAAGAVLGVVIAIWGTNALRILPLTGLPLRFDTSIDSTGLALAVALAVIAGLVIGAVPTVQLSRLDAQEAIRAGARAPGRNALRNGLVAAQVSLAMMVLVAAGIALRSYLETRDVDPGFRREGVLLAAYELTGRAPNAAATRAFTARLLDTLRAVPGAEAAAVASSVPLDIHGLPMRIFTVEGRARSEAGDDAATANTVTPGYFDVMGIPFRAGRDFSSLDATGPLEVVVNEEFVRRFLAGGQAVGRRLTARARPHVIVGVVATSIANAFGEAPTPMLYFSYRDVPLPMGEMHLRTRAGSEASIGQDVRRAVRDLDADVPVFNVRTLTDHVETNLVLRRIPARLFAVIGPLLLSLAAIGIYAVVAYTSSLRKTEVGVRLAVGATPAQIVRQFLRETLTGVMVGGALGWVLALVLSMRLVPKPVDTPVFVAVPIVLLLVAALACWVPARGASRLDPTAALRPE